MGFAGNIEPTFMVPTVVANAAKKSTGSVHISQTPSAQGLADADFYIGDEAYSRKDSPNYLLSSPVSKGRIDNWDDMERFLQQAIFRNLRCIPEDHDFLLTEPPFNTPENRELMAEMMFETFNVNGLYIGVQAVLALYGQSVSEAEQYEGHSPNLTGLVVDAGDGLSHVIPVADGYVISSCIQELQIAGKHVTQFVHDMICDRGEPVPAEQRMHAAVQIKEKHAYLCKDVVSEYQKFDQDPVKRFKTLAGVFPKTKKEWKIEIGYERFLAPEIFFHPEIFVDGMTTPLPQVVDNCISQCPIDYRRRLYNNIVLSGGSTAFQYFKERLQHEVQHLVDERLQKAEIQTGRRPQDIEVCVHGSKKRAQQRYAAWLGGSLLAQEAVFARMLKTKREYEEVGPACMRGSPVAMS